MLDGSAHIDDYVKIAKECSHPAITILDHGNMSGTFEFYQKCKAAGIKPVIGMEAYLNDELGKHEEEKYEGKDTHQSIIIKNQAGYVSLNKLTYKSFTEGYYRRGRITTDWLIENKSGLMITTSCMASKIARLVAEGKESEAEERLKLLMREFGDDLFAELQFNEIPEQKIYNRFILKMIKKYSLMPILTGDVHYAIPEDNRLQDVLISINQKKQVNDPNAFKLQARHLYYANVEDFHRMNKEFGYNYPESFVDLCLENTLKVSDKCSFEFETDVNKYPQYTPTKDVVEVFKTENTKEIITKLAHGKLKQKFKKYKETGVVKLDDEKIKQYKDRLDYELKVIGDKGMLDYFLVVWELMRFCKDNDIVTGPGRGCFVPGSRVKMADGLYAPIETVRVGDEVIDAFGEIRKVIDTKEYDVNEEIIELEFENGKKIRCTKDHKIHTKNREWVEAENLTKNDEISEV
jgi:DNA polymerase-3 subunit alpha